MAKLALFLVGISTSAGAQIMLKTGVASQAVSVWQSIFNWPIATAILLYFVSFVCYALFLKDTELSLAAPIFIAGVVLLIFCYGLLNGESVTAARGLGAALILSGIFVIQFAAG